jgi:hypothetical protein
LLPTQLPSIFEINQLTNGNKILFKQFKHIYVISENTQEIQQISFVDIETSCCILVPTSLKSIPKSYFFDNPRLPKGGYGDFDYNENIPLEGFSLNLLSFHLYSEINEISEKCFYGCKSLKEIHLPNSITELGKGCFSGCSQLTTIKLPDSIKELPPGCFYKCDSLVHILLPKSISDIGNYCFSLSNLQNISCDILVRFGRDTFSGCPFWETNEEEKK